MIKFNGLVIEMDTDYKDRIEKGIGLGCLQGDVYDENDTEFENDLLGFTIVPGIDFENATVEEVETAVRRAVEREWATIQLVRANMKLERTKELFHNAVVYIKEVTDPKEYKKIFKDVIGMIDEEIESALEELSEKQAEGMNIS